MNTILPLFQTTGFFHLTPGMILMWLIGITLIYLAISKNYEPLLLLPIGFGIILANLPLTSLMEPNEGLLWRFYHYGIQWEIIPPLIFLGLGALTDFGVMLSRPSLLFLGAGAQAGVYLTFFVANVMGFSINESATIGIIGGADGPMTKSRKVSKLEKIFFPVVSSLVIILLIPAAAPLIAMLMLGNLFREAKVVERLTHASQNELLNIVTIFLGISIGATMNAELFLKWSVISIFVLGLFAFAISTGAGVILAKTMNLFLKDKINPLLGAAGVSAVPMAARVVHKVGQEADKKNYLLMYAMGPNVAGVIGTVIAAGIFLTLLQ